jgi:hypothetical protein
METIFITVAQFKSQTGCTAISVRENARTGKLFVTTDTGEVYKCQQDIDKTKEMKFRIEGGAISDACLVNVNNTATELFSL